MSYGADLYNDSLSFSAFTLGKKMVNVYSILGLAFPLTKILVYYEMSNLSKP